MGIANIGEGMVFQAQQPHNGTRPFTSQPAALAQSLPQARSMTDDPCPPLQFWRRFVSLDGLLFEFEVQVSFVFLKASFFVVNI